MPLSFEDAIRRCGTCNFVKGGGYCGSAGVKQLLKAVVQKDKLAITDVLSCPVSPMKTK